MDIPKPLQKVIDKAAELNAEVKAVGLESFKELLKGFFAAHPIVVRLRWTQSTSHFNDGDPRTFSGNEPEVEVLDKILLAKRKPNGYPDEDQYSVKGEFVDAWSIKGEHKDLAASLDEIHVLFQRIEDVMNAVFGDGVEVTVTRDGEIDIDDYDHD